MARINQYSIITFSGSTDFYKQIQFPVEVRTAIMHPDFQTSNSLAFDIAILELAQAQLIPRPQVGLVCLPTSDQVT